MTRGLVNKLLHDPMVRGKALAARPDGDLYVAALRQLYHLDPDPADARRIGIGNDDLVRVNTAIGWFVVRAWVTEGLRPGIVACSHHMGRWRLGGGSRASATPSTRSRTRAPRGSTRSRKHVRTVAALFPRASWRGPQSDAHGTAPVSHSRMGKWLTDQRCIRSLCWKFVCATVKSKCGDRLADQTFPGSIDSLS